jgi:cytoskeletal protein CcmA (bactofilin family)
VTRSSGPPSAGEAAHSHRRRSEVPSVRAREGHLEPNTTPTGRRFTDGAVAPTVIGKGTRVRGDIETGDAIEIRGVLEGDCVTSAHCIVHEGARVLGNIGATALVVAGEVEAGVLAAEKVELRASARVVATIRTRVIAIRDGAFYQGQIEDADEAGGPSLFKDRRRNPPQQ